MRYFFKILYTIPDNDWLLIDAQIGRLYANAYKTYETVFYQHLLTESVNMR